MNRTKMDSGRKKDLLFLAGLILGGFFLFWKSKYGTGAYDEPFYLTIPHRIVNGDGFLSEEWNFGQFSSFLLLPLMKVYLLLRGGTEGIVLCFRYFYILFQVLCTVVLYLRLRKKELAWAAAWLFLLFTPYDIMALSYNTMGLACMTLTGVLLSTAKEKAVGTWVVSGILFAAAVLCNPFLAILYFVYSAAVVVLAVRGKRQQSGGREARGRMRNGSREADGKIQCVFGGKAWLCITAGAAGLAVLFLAALLWHSPILELLENIPFLMNDPEHTSRSVLMIVQVFVMEFWKVYGFFLPVWAVFLFMAYRFRKEASKRYICFLLLSVSGAVSILFLLPTIQNSYNFIMVPIAVCGLGAYIMTKQKDVQSFAFLYVFGIAYAFMANYASNQGMHAIAMAMIPADVAAVLFVGRFLAQEKEHGVKACRVCVFSSAIVLFVVQFGMQIYTKAVHTFWEEPVWKLQTCIEEGPLKGTVTTKEKAERYQTKLTDIREHMSKTGPVLFAGKDTWCYLYADAEYGTFSTYLSGGLKQAAKRLEVYYEVHPEKIPQYIYIAKADVEEGMEDIVQTAKHYGYWVEESESAFHLYGQ